MNNSSFFANLLTWFDQHGRKDFPWQNPRSPYFVWLSEVMLQQTQVATVIPYFERFVKRFESLKSLATATQDEVMPYWAGLGYYSRARNLHRAAQMIQQEFGGKFPDNLEDLQKLPGIGKSTAGAILAQAFESFGVILDGNVKRVLSRYFADSDLNEKKLWVKAEELTPQKRIKDYTQAIMDLGATICTRSKPKCLACPLQENCKAFALDKIAEFPVKKIKAKIPLQEKYFFICKNNAGKILFEQQPSPGIWGGLWSLPSAEELPLGLSQEKLLEPLQHAFSHFKLKLKPVLLQQTNFLSVQESLPQQWFGIEELQDIALPAPIKKILQREDPSLRSG